MHMRSILAASVAILSTSAFVLPGPFELPELVTTSNNADLVGTVWNTWKTLAEWASIIAPDTNDMSIYQILEDDKDLSKFLKLVNLDEDMVQLLNETRNTEVTLLAPNNDAIRRPIGGGGGDGDAVVQIYQYAEKNSLFSKPSDDEDDEKKRLREIFRRMLKSVLQYHTFPQPLSTSQLAQNSTTMTGLKATDGSYGGQFRRVKIESRLVPPGIVLNSYAKIVKRDIKAKNGYVHIIDHPLFPPPSIVDVTFLVSKYLSTFTSAMQKLRLDNLLEWKYVRGRGKGDKGHFKGSPAMTLFAPSNEAWNKLPDSLLYYLFSPFGEQALNKLMRFHVVPNYIIHAEWVQHVDPHQGHSDRFQTPFTLNPPNPSVPFDRKFVVPSLLEKHSLPIHIIKSNPSPVPIPGTKPIRFWVDDKEVEYMDGVASNGAVHILDDVLDPRNKGQPGESSTSGWENWEDWFVKWAEEA